MAVTRVLAILLTACAPAAAVAPCERRDPYVDALAAVRALGAPVDEHVALRSYDGEPRGYEVNGVRVVVLPRPRLATIAAGYGYAAAVGVAAHELAHLPGVQAPWAPPEGEVEAYADSVAGCALGVLELEVDGYAELVGREGEGRAKAARRGWAICERRFR